MSTPLPVTIVRPKPERSESVARVVVGISMPFLRAYILMLLAPVVTPWHPSFWQSVAAVLIANVAIPYRTDYALWTRKTR